MSKPSIDISDLEEKLILLCYHTYGSPDAMARALKVETSEVVQALQRLESIGFILREESPGCVNRKGR